MYEFSDSAYKKLIRNEIARMSNRSDRTVVDYDFFISKNYNLTWQIGMAAVLDILLEPRLCHAGYD